MMVLTQSQDGYKVVVFDFDTFGIDGRVLGGVCWDLSDPHRVSHELLRWHFKQLVFANIRGVGEPILSMIFRVGI